MKKIVRLKESDLQRIVKRVLNEQVEGIPNDEEYIDIEVLYDSLGSVLKSEVN